MNASTRAIEIKIPKWKSLTGLLSLISVGLYVFRMPYRHHQLLSSPKVYFVVVFLLVGLSLVKYLINPMYFKADEIGLTRYFYWSKKNYLWNEIGELKIVRNSRRGSGYDRVEFHAIDGGFEPLCSVYLSTLRIPPEDFLAQLLQLSPLKPSNPLLKIKSGAAA